MISFLHIWKIETFQEERKGVHVNPTMFSILRDLQDALQMANTLHSFHFMRDAVYEEDCHGVMTRCVFEKH